MSQKENQEEREKKNNIVDFAEAKKMLKEVHRGKSKSKQDEEAVVEKPIGSEPMTTAEIAEEIEEAFFMGKQEAIYQTVAAFLSTPEAVKYRITGVEIKIENGYINCYWQFGERSVPTDGR